MTKSYALPIGVSDYKELNEYYSADKTGMIADILDDKAKVFLFCRPRRFGKTLNMTMLKAFFEKSDKATSCYFVNKEIWQKGEKYTKEQGKYPVIFLSFKDVKSKTFEAAMQVIYLLVSEEYGRHYSACKSLEGEDFRYYESILSRRATQAEVEFSLKRLTRFLKELYGVPAIIIIDEYDTALQTACTEGYYEDMIAFMRPFLSGGLKDNSNLKFGFLTGITRVAKESIFSGLNNLMVDTILSKKYGKYFGFTQNEVNEMAALFEAEDKLSEIKEWYDGYIFGNDEIYNPWSVVNYFKNDCEPDSYWVSTASNDILGQLIQKANENGTDKLKLLYEGKSVDTIIEPHICYKDLEEDTNLLFSFLAISGYVKCTQPRMIDGECYCKIKIPNSEIRWAYKKEILSLTKKRYTMGLTGDITKALVTGHTEEFLSLLKSFMLQTMSYYDATEGFYQGLMLTLCALTTDFYRITSNRESGFGRFDFAFHQKSRVNQGISLSSSAVAQTKTSGKRPVKVWSKS